MDPVMAFTIHNILVPVDFSEASERSLAVALDLANTLKAKVHLVHIYQIPVYGFPDGALLTGPEVASQLADAAQKGLDRIVAENKGKGVPVTASLRQGSAHEEIINAASEQLADLIVMGTHGRGLIAHALLGSVTERVVRLSPVPVMTIRHKS
jgi:nucleotide-binding universal stress UspA family protein